MSSQDNPSAVVFDTFSTSKCNLLSTSERDQGVSAQGMASGPVSQRIVPRVSWRGLAICSMCFSGGGDGNPRGHGMRFCWVCAWRLHHHGGASTAGRLEDTTKRHRQNRARPKIDFFGRLRPKTDADKPAVAPDAGGGRGQSRRPQPDPQDRSQRGFSRPEGRGAGRSGQVEVIDRPGPCRRTSFSISRPRPAAPTPISTKT